MTDFVKLLATLHCCRLRYCTSTSQISSWDHTSHCSDPRSYRTALYHRYLWKVRGVLPQQTWILVHKHRYQLGRGLGVLWELVGRHRQDIVWDGENMPWHQLWELPVRRHHYRGHSTLLQLEVDSGTSQIGAKGRMISTLIGWRTASHHRSNSKIICIEDYSRNYRKPSPSCRTTLDSAVAEFIK